MSEAKVKNPSVSAKVFTDAFVNGRAAGKSNTEIATGLGMKVSSFNVRVSALKAKCKAECEAKPGTVNPFDNPLIAKGTRHTNSAVSMLAGVLASIAKVDETPSTGDVVASETPSA